MRNKNTESIDIGVDIGGTFTDAVVIRNGETELHKSPSTPDKPVEGVMNALEIAAGDHGESLQEFLSKTDSFTHGSTVGTNAVVEHDLPKIGGIVTEGFKDTLTIRRGLKGSGTAGDFVPGESLYDPHITRPPNLVDRSLTKEVDERMNHEGNVEKPLDVEAVRETIRELIDAGVESIAVCLLFSTLNSEHEEKIMQLIREESEEVYENSTYSSNVSGLIREYERFSSAVLDAALKPIMKPYIQDLESRLHSSGLSDDVPSVIMQLHGGVADASILADRPVTTLGSGPAAGVVGGEFIAETLEEPNLVTMDMGGTTFDIGVVESSDAITKPITTVAGYHIMVPMIDVTSIGAGGGSIASVEKGQLTIGPESAGADPGPACYDAGGTRPTTTDINLLLGYLNPDNFWGGKMDVSVAKAKEAVENHVANEMGVSVHEAAAAAFDLANAKMIDQLRLATVERGLAPEDYTGLVYGGAGAAHAPVLSREIGMKKCIIPAEAAGYSALGLVSAPYKHTYARVVGPAFLEDIKDEYELVNENLSEMVEKGRATLSSEGIDEEDMIFKPALDMRFKKQLDEITVPLPSLEIEPSDKEVISETFLEEYQKAYGQAPDYPIEYVNVRLNAIGKRELEYNGRSLAKADPSAAQKGTRDAYYGEVGKFVETNVYAGDELVPGNVIEGRSIIEFPETTVVVRPDQNVEIDRFNNIIIETSTALLNPATASG